MNKQKIDSTCDQGLQPLLTMSEALEFLLNASIVNTNTCSVSLDDALRILITYLVSSNSSYLFFCILITLLKKKIRRV
jgi:hypothetical protein